MTETEEKTEFSFDELSEAAKSKAREAYTGEGYLHDDWWDNVYEDAVRMARIVGITFDDKAVKLMSGKTRYDPSIYFSGFSSQGDGACFAGNYAFMPGAVTEISGETNDKEPVRIAMELHTLQITRRLLGLEYFTASVTTSGGYSHSGTMVVGVKSDDDDEDSAEFDAALEDKTTQLMRNFADWIYKQLEAEHDWLYSDECVDESIKNNELVFDEGGDLQS